MAKKIQGSKEPDEIFAFKSESDHYKMKEPIVHSFGNAVVCDTDSLGHPTPGDRSPLEIVVDASEGFIPLWDKGLNLRWRFNEASMSVFVRPDAAKSAIRELFREAVMAWGDAAPIRFSERSDAHDFEIVVRSSDNCSISGCTLASAFFPDSGRHQMVIYPKMFSQIRTEQVETLVHEIGHTFGLRHFFANVSETAWPSEIFGEHNQFSIMNYGHKSQLTENDKSDLKALYEMSWCGGAGHINGTPIRLVKPYHYFGGI